MTIANVAEYYYIHNSLGDVDLIEMEALSASLVGLDGTFAGHTVSVLAAKLPSASHSVRSSQIVTAWFGGEIDNDIYSF